MQPAESATLSFYCSRYSTPASHVSLFQRTVPDPTYSTGSYANLLTVTDSAQNDRPHVHALRALVPRNFYQRPILSLPVIPTRRRSHPRPPPRLPSPPSLSCPARSAERSRRPKPHTPASFALCTRTTMAFPVPLLAPPVLHPHQHQHPPLPNPHHQFQSPPPSMPPPPSAALRRCLRRST